MSLQHFNVLQGSAHDALYDTPTVRMLGQLSRFVQRMQPSQLAELHNKLSVNMTNNRC